jgi:hypothetical protein
MSSRAHVIQRLKAQDQRFTLTEADIWDILPAAKGLTILMLDGDMYPLLCAEGAAQQLLQMWAVENRA